MLIYFLFLWFLIIYMSKLSDSIYFKYLFWYYSYEQQSSVSTIALGRHWELSFTVHKRQVPSGYPYFSLFSWCAFFPSHSCSLSVPYTSVQLCPVSFLTLCCCFLLLRCTLPSSLHLHPSDSAFSNFLSSLYFFFFMKYSRSMHIFCLFILL